MSSPESLRLHIPDKTTSWTTSICSTISEEVDSTSSLTTHYQNEYIFWWDMFFKNSINAYYFHMVNQSPSTSEYIFLSFPQAFFLINFNIFQLQLFIFIITHQLYHYLLTVFPSLSNFKFFDSFHLVSEFLAIYYWFLDAADAGYRVQG